MSEHLKELAKAQAWVEKTRRAAKEASITKKGSGDLLLATLVRKSPFAKDETVEIVSPMLERPYSITANDVFGFDAEIVKGPHLIKFSDGAYRAVEFYDGRGVRYE